MSEVRIVPPKNQIELRVNAMEFVWPPDQPEGEIHRRHIVCPRFEEGNIITPRVVRQLIQWCLSAK